MKKSLTKNYFFNLTYQILVIVLPLITTPYISRVLGAENIGIYSYTISISAYFVLLGSLGINLYGQREIAYKQKDKNEYTMTFWEIIMLKFITMSISMIIFYFCFVYSNNQYKTYFMILLIELLANILDISWFLMGLEEFKKTIIINSAIKIICLILTFMLIKTKDDLIIYFLIYVFSLLLANISMWIYMPKLLKKINIKELKVFKHLKPTVALFVPQIAVQIYTLLDKTMIGTIIENKAEVGFYDQSQKIIKTCLVIITALGTVMLPRIANDFANGNKKQIDSYIKKSFNIVFLLAFPMIFGIFAVSDKFVPLFFGEGYEKVIILMKIISPIILLIGMSNITGMQFLFTTGKQKEYTISVIAGAGINFIMNLFLIPKYGEVGASIGTVIAELSVTSIQLFFVRRYFNFKSIFIKSKNYIIASIIMFAICKIVNMVNTTVLISLMLQTVVAVISYFIILIIMRDEFVIEKIEIIKNKFINREEKCL